MKQFNTTSEMKVRLQHHSGSDLSPLLAARKSFGRETDWLSVNDKEYDPSIHGPAYGDYPLQKNGHHYMKEADHNLLKYLVRGIKTSEYEDMLDLITNTNDKTEIAKLLWRFRQTPTHHAPFNHMSLTLDCEAPIFLHRQLV